MNSYEQFIHKSKYARFQPDKGRRETWEETVTRYVSNLVPPNLSKAEQSRLKAAILNLEVLPSMRALMTAGPALIRDNVAGYNCAYTPIDDRRVFDEIMYILMCGTGVGFSVERKYIDKLPTIAEEFYDDGSTTIHIADSRIGWATGFRKLVSLLYDGLVPLVDYSSVRAAGSPLSTFGGRASGPAPLRALCEYTINLFKNAKGRKLNDIECHDLVCKIAEAIVCGGVRRSALISLSNASSDRLRSAKSGLWHTEYPQRALANNSVCYTERPDVSLFIKEWASLIESRSGERGIFSRVAASRGLPDRREPDHEWGTNPCSEIILRPRQFCNLTEVVAREDDTIDTLKERVEIATILGTIQSTYTDFRYLGKRWKDNCEEERLLGVSLTGIMDCHILNGTKEGLEGRLQLLRDHAIQTNDKWAKKLGINPSAAITCVKPSGTVSQLVGSSSGIHPRYSKFYIRRVRNDIKDPLSKALIDQGVPYEVDVTNHNQYIFSFPIRSPAKSTTIYDVTALDQCKLWAIYNKHWCEHKPSVSIYVKDEEWLDVGAWVYNNFDDISGMSFFPHSNHSYQQAPYEAITEGAYQLLVDAFPNEICYDFFELTDATTGSHELACSGPQGCEIL